MEHKTVRKKLNNLGIGFEYAIAIGTNYDALISAHINHYKCVQATYTQINLYS